MMKLTCCVRIDPGKPRQSRRLGLRVLGRCVVKQREVRMHCLHKLKPVGWKDSMPLTKQSKGVVHWIEEGTLHLLLIEVLVLKCEFLRKAEKAMEKRMLVARDRLVDMFIHARSNLPWQHQWPLR